VLAVPSTELSGLVRNDYSAGAMPEQPLLSGQLFCSVEAQFIENVSTNQSCPFLDLVQDIAIMIEDSEALETLLLAKGHCH
jgi:hypothetical protein